MKEKMLAAGNIDEDDFLIFKVLDDPKEIVDYVRRIVIL
jgi:hypothetical protein